MKDIQIIDLIITDIHKYLIKNKINPVNIELIQNNGVPILCEGKITADEKIMINEYLKRYKDRYTIFKLIINYHYGSLTNAETEIGKKQLGNRLKNFIKNEDDN
jgi:hypothetical protein